MKTKKEHPNQQHCAACNRYVKYSSRYPSYACPKCVSKANDDKGRAIAFHNTTEDGHGCQGRLIGSDELTNSNICFIKGMKFRAQEAYLGGIVLLLVNDAKLKKKRKVQNSKPVIV